MRGIALILFTSLLVVEASASDVLLKVSEEKRSRPAVGPNITHVAPLTFYFLEGVSYDWAKIRTALREAQLSIEKCGIQVYVENVVTFQAPRWLASWEPLIENDNSITRWEWLFFSNVPANSSGVLFVEGYEWTIGEDGLTGLGYSRFLTNLIAFRGGAKEQQFYNERMVGHVVVGKAMRASTLLHELGHAILNLEHVEDPRNPMHPRWGRVDPEFTESQCITGRANFPQVRPLNQKLRPQRIFSASASGEDL